MLVYWPARPCCTPPPHTHTALMDSYADQERLLWEQLSGLVTDAAWLESYAGAAMLKVKETMQVGMTLVPVQLSPVEGLPGGTQHGMGRMRFGISQPMISFWRHVVFVYGALLLILLESYAAAAMLKVKETMRVGMLSLSY